MALSSMGLFDWLSAGAVLGLIAIAVGVALIKSLAEPAPKTGRQ
jgi:hypothetical protein